MKKLIWGIIIVVVIIAGLVYYNSYLAKPVCWPYCENITDQDREKIKESALNAATANWKIYKFNGSSYIQSGPISFKYPSDWVLDTTYNTTPAGVKDITSITITSPDGIGQIAFSNGGNQGNLTCQALDKMNSQEPRGKIVCNMINNTPFYLTYTTNSELVEIYNKIIDSIIRLK